MVKRQIKHLKVDDSKWNMIMTSSRGGLIPWVNMATASAGVMVAEPSASLVATKAPALSKLWGASGDIYWKSMPKICAWSLPIPHYVVTWCKILTIFFQQSPNPHEILSFSYPKMFSSWILLFKDFVSVIEQLQILEICVCCLCTFRHFFHIEG